MLYPYKCDDCNEYVEEIKPVSQHTTAISCGCGSNMRQVFSISKPNVDKMEAEYYPSLGTVVKSRRHRAELIKSRGLIEVGNEKPATVHNGMANQLRDRLNKNYGE